MRPCPFPSEVASSLRRLLAITVLGVIASATSSALAQAPAPPPGSAMPAPAPAPGSAPVPAPGSAPASGPGSAAAAAPAPAPAPAPPEPIPAGAAAEEPGRIPGGAVAEEPGAEPVSNVAMPPEDQVLPTSYFPFNLSIFYPLGMNAARPDILTNFDLSIVLGRVGFTEGAQIGLINWTAHDLTGIQLGLAGVIGHTGEGLQAAGAFTFVDGPFAGVQASGIFGWASASFEGVQLAAIANQTYGDLTGFQVAGLANIARKQLTGVQIGAINVARVDGLQVGGINISQEQRGLQIGVINVARRIDGLQIGVINITDNLDGESLGIIPLPRRGGIRLLLWGSTGLYGNAGIKFSSRYAYSILSAAFHSEPAKDGGTGRDPVYAGGLTMGARLPFDWEGFTLGTDIGAYRLFRDELAFTGHDELYRMRLVGAYALAGRLAPFITAGAFITHHGDEIGAGPDLGIGLEL
ncbi:MAG: hypothetical protein IT372_10585 [Polyangiaceae bacterium]|nr:hypothetical protein [Polyangiaceae bacterium]